MISYAYMDSPAGKLLVAGNKFELTRITFPNSKKKPYDPEPGWQEKPEILKNHLIELEEYFKGQRKDFEMKLAPYGTKFQLDVLDVLLKIPYGHTMSYGEVAAEVGNPKASRAVGGAVGWNPLPIVIPCHRVIGSNGTLTGFGGGLDVKRILLDLERQYA